MNNFLAVGETPPRASIDPGLLLETLPSAVMALDGGRRFVWANPACEQLFGIGRSLLLGRTLDEFLPPGTPLAALLEQVRRGEGAVSEYGILLARTRGGSVIVDAHLTPIVEVSDHVLVTLHPCSVAQTLDQHLAHRGQVRSVAALARTLAHEVKNPLSGIRGAAQLLEPTIGPEDKALVSLICDEADRICGLVDRMDAFSETAGLVRRPVNIHRVLDYVRRIAESGFARDIRIVERYDPSLPEVDGDRDALIQLFLNLVKNAAEAVPRGTGRITLATHYRHGLKMSTPTSAQRLELPIAVEVRDNGAGVPPDLEDDLFEPFVTSKSKGSGLGLALVAKITGDHGGIVDYRAGAPGAIFRVSLPSAAAAHEEVRAE